MDTKVKAIKARLTYESDLSGIQKDLATLKSIRRRLEKTPLRVPIALDLSGMKSQVAKAAGEYRKAMQAEMAKVRMAPGAGGMSAGGIAIPAGAVRDLERYGAASGKVFKTVTKDAGKAKEVVTSFEQVMRGVQRMTTKTKKGESSTIINTKPVEALKAAMEQINRDFDGKIGSAKASKGGVARLLEEKRAAMDKEIGKHAKALEGHPALIAAKKAESKLLSQIAETNAKEAQAATKKQIDGRRGSLKQGLEKIDSDFSQRLGSARGNKGDVAGVLMQKRRRIAEELSKFGDIASSPEFKAAQKSINSMGAKIAETLPRQAEAREKKAAAAQKSARAQASKGASRTVTDVDRARGNRERGIAGEISSARHIRDEATRTAELNRHLDAREKLIERTAKAYERLEQRARKAGNADAADKFKTAGLRTRKDLGVIRGERMRGDEAAETAAKDRALAQSIGTIKREHAAKLQVLDAEEKTARATMKRVKLQRELERITKARQELGRETSGRLGAVHREASSAGKHTIAANAAKANEAVMAKLDAANRKMGAAARKSGHDIDFHSSSLLRNAATFTKWFIPAQLVMGTFSAIGAGARSAVDAQRTFKVLNAVFRGTREEAEMLARQTLQLAAANGRDAQEAAEAAVSWARLGLTRTQVLLAMETSLRAANVAEISTADATKYLTAQYKAFNQTLTDIPANLDLINSLSNQYNVTPENIMQGIARTATVAKQAGLEYEKLASIIAIVSDVTGRPGEETGNALKFILTRIRRPQTLDPIKEEFGLDLRTPAGDAKKMSDIFAELAALYPTLNRIEKARINDLVAGSRQVERYAVIVDNWTEILIANAKASFDANSAQRENAEILSSVDASLQQVSTSWTAFMTALGEAGVFKAVSEGLKGIAYELENISRLGNDFVPPDVGAGAKKIPLSESAEAFVRDTYDQVGGISLGDSMDKKYDAPMEEQIDFAIRDIEKYLKKGKVTGWDKTKALAGFGGQRLTGMSKAEMEQMLTELRIAKSGGESGSTVADSASRLAMEQGVKVRALNGLNQSKDAFSKMSKDMLLEGVDSNKMLKQFDDSVGLLENLPGGLKNVAEARLKLRPLMAAGDRQGASAGLAEIAGRFGSQLEMDMPLTEESRVEKLADVNKEVQIHQARLKALNEEMAKEDSALAMEKYEDAIGNVSDRLKEAEEAAKALGKAATLDELQASTAAQIAAVEEYTKDLAMVQEIIGGTLTGFGNTGIADLDQKLRIGGSLLQRDLARDGLAATERSNQEYAEGRQGLMDIYKDSPNAGMRERVAAIGEEIRARDEIASKLRSELGLIEEATKEVERRLELQRQADELSGAYSDGGAAASARLGAYGIGATDGERITNRTVGALGMARGIAGDPATGAGDALSDARELGTLTAALTDAKAGILSMEQRMHAAVAERANLEIEITEQAMKQREEATKRLALASREDQLRAAAASAVLRNRGSDGFSMQEFQFFGQDTKGALSNLMPEKVKGLDDTERDNDRSRAKLDREVAGIAASIGGMRDVFEEVRRMAAERAGDLASGMRPEVVDGNRVADLSQGEARVNLKLGDVVMNFDLAPHMARMQAALQGRIDEKMNQIIEQFKRPFVGPPAPNTAPATSAF
jgi:TP901 family phage tail tape measure protein